MKKKHEMAEIEIVEFDNEDVITTSDDSGDITLPEQDFD